MRPRHKRHSYKDSKFRNRNQQYQFMFEWLQMHFLPKYLRKNGGPFNPFRDPSKRTWTYKNIRKLYNAWYKQHTKDMHEIHSIRNQALFDSLLYGESYLYTMPYAEAVDKVYGS